MWTVERIVHFEPGDFVKDGLSHFGFRHGGRLYAVDHAGQVAALVGDDGKLEWTVAARPVVDGVPHVDAALDFPMYVDLLPGGSPIVSNFGDARLWRIDLRQMRADVLVDGRGLGMVDMGNCVVDGSGRIWVNEVRGGRVWRFDRDGGVVRTVEGFGWIYDIRIAPGGEVFVLDSGNFALRAIAPETYAVRTVAEGFASDPTARFDGPISLALDEDGTAYVGDRFAYVVREVDPASGAMTTIAGRGGADDARANDPGECDPRRLNLPQISSMDYCSGRLYVPTDLDGDRGDLAVLRRL